jgi:hypothetical protein
MVAVTAAIFLSAWRTGAPARIAIAGMVALQLVWGGDIPFLPARYGNNSTALEKSIHLLSSTFRGDNRLNEQSDLERVATALPDDSVVLIHLAQVRLGIGHPAVTDNPRWTAAPLLGSLEGPAAAWRQLHDWGVTHLLLMNGRCSPGDLDLESELATHYLAQFASNGFQYIDGKIIVKLSDHEPDRRLFADVVYCSCSRRERVPWHALDANFSADRLFSSPVRDLPTVTELLFDGLDSAVIDERCPVQFPESIAGHWKRVSEWKETQLWMRDRPAEPASPP